MADHSGHQARAAQSSKPKGQLSKQLARDKSRTMSDMLADASQGERRKRDIDQSNDFRNYN